MTLGSALAFAGRTANAAATLLERTIGDWLRGGSVVGSVPELRDLRECCEYCSAPNMYLPGGFYNRLGPWANYKSVRERGAGRGSRTVEVRSASPRSAPRSALRSAYVLSRLPVINHETILRGHMDRGERFCIQNSSIGNNPFTIQE